MSDIQKPGFRQPWKETGDLLIDRVNEMYARPRLHVGPTDPGFTGPGLWVQTGLGADGSGMTIWIEDGT